MTTFKLWLESDGRELTFNDASVSIGRDPGADLFIDHPTVSRQHALIVEHPNGHMLVVLSTSGLTAIDGQQVTGNVELRDGNRLNFGQVSAVFRSSAASVGGVDPMGMTAAMPGVGAPSIDHEAKTQALSAVDASASLPTGPPIAPGSPGMPSGFPAVGQAPLPQQAQEHAPAAAENPLASVGRPSQHGIVSWDDIAAQAAAQQAAEEREATDYEKLQAAAAKAQKGSGSSPIVPIALVLIVGLMGFILFYEPEEKKRGEGGEVAANDAPIAYSATDLKCIDAECMKLAREKYRLGMENLRKKKADLGNTYRAYMAFDMTKEFLRAGGVDKPGAEFAELDAKHAETKAELDELMGDFLRRVHQARQRKQWDDMLAVLREARVYFPDKRAWGHRWADERELWMKEQGVMPKNER